MATSSNFDLNSLLTALPSENEEDKAKKLLEPNEIIRTIDSINNWIPHESNECYKLVTLNELSSEYLTIESDFENTMSLTLIKKIQRIQNPYLYAQYLLKCKQMGDNGIRPKEISMFHGTYSGNIDKTCRNNFDWRRCGSARGHKFGRGVSFSPLATYASHYGDHHVMFYVKVLVGRCMTGNVMTTVPPENYDTTDNGKGTVYVKYEDNDFYPAYLIYY